MKWKSLEEPAIEYAISSTPHLMELFRLLFCRIETLAREHIMGLGKGSSDEIMARGGSGSVELVSFTHCLLLALSLSVLWLWFSEPQLLPPCLLTACCLLSPNFPLSTVYCPGSCVCPGHWVVLKTSVHQWDLSCFVFLRGGEWGGDLRRPHLAVIRDY